jgi:hypothetical protein
MSMMRSFSFVHRMSSARKRAANDGPLDLGGSLQDLHDLRLARAALHRKVRRVPVPAEHLFTTVKKQTVANGQRDTVIVIRALAPPLP